MPMMLRAERILLALYLATMPIHWSPFPWNIQWSDLVFAGLALVAVRHTRGRARASAVLDGLVVAYVAGALFSFFATSDLTRSALQYAKHVYVAAVYFVVVSITRDEDGSTFAGRWCAVVGAAVAAVSLLAVVVYHVSGVLVPWIVVLNDMPVAGHTVRPYGPLSSAAYLANYLTFSLPFVLALALRTSCPGWRVVWQAATMAVVGAAVATLSPAAGGVLVAGLICAWPHWTERGMVRTRWAAAAAASVAVVGLNFVSAVSIRDVDIVRDHDQRLAPPPYAHGLQDERGAERVTVAVSYNVVGYLRLKMIAWQAFERHPLTGIGLGRFHQETDRAYREGHLPEAYRAIDPHSALPGRLAEAGVAGGATLLALWAGALWLGLRTRGVGHGWPRRAAFAAIVGLLVNAINVDVMNFRFLWVAVALLPPGCLARSEAV